MQSFCALGLALNAMFFLIVSLGLVFLKSSCSSYFSNGPISLHALVVVSYTHFIIIDLWLSSNSTP